MQMIKSKRNFSFLGQRAQDLLRVPGRDPPPSFSCVEASVSRDSSLVLPSCF